MNNDGEDEKGAGDKINVVPCCGGVCIVRFFCGMNCLMYVVSHLLS